MPSPSLSVAALLFDMDGVLLHSTPIHVKTWTLFLQRKGMKVPDIQGRMLGMRNDELVAELFGPNLSREERQQIGREKEALYRELMAPVLEEHLVPGVREFILRHRDLPMAVVSNAERANIDLVLDGAGLRPYFAAVVDGSEVERPKPFPDIYLIAARQLGVSPEECVIFEDSQLGIAAAKATGAQVVGLRTTLRELPPVDLAIDDFHSPELDWRMQNHAAR